jgi:hypothetical protein
MAFVFYVLGWLGILGGGGWVALALYAARNVDQTSPYAESAVLGSLIAMAPGFSVSFGGLLVLAIGGGLARLDGILRYSRMSARTLQDLHEAMQPDPR